MLCAMKRRSQRAGAGQRGNTPAGTVRLIAGDWRGRKLPVPDLPGLRPTGDRGRETLFNWLQAGVPGARCADLFAGSGALGFEAASRGAAEVHLVEIAPLAVSALVDSRDALGARQVQVHRSNVLDWLHAGAAGPFDIVFVDPPFDSGLAIRTLQALAEGGHVAPGGFIYVETAARLPALVMHPPFELHREKVMGEARLQLFRRADS